MTQNPYESPVEARATPISRTWPHQLARVAIVTSLLSHLSTYLSTRFFWEGRLPEEWHKPWIWSWIQGAIAMWIIAQLLAAIALMGRRDRMTIGAMILAETPLWLPLLIVVKWLFMGV
jgi:hypothetical protein